MMSSQSAIIYKERFATYIIQKEFVCAQFVFCFLTDEGYLALKFAPIVPIQ